MKQSLFASSDELNQQFARRIAAILARGIDENGSASLVVSGGRTPVPLFEALSNIEIQWNKVHVTLADERWVDADNEASNEKSVIENLIKNCASGTKFTGLKHPVSDAEQGVELCTQALQTMKAPFDVLLLGMGEDGHTASLFPCSEQIAAGLALDSGADFIAVTPTTAPNQRMSMTLPRLLKSENIFLHLVGEGKKQVLDKALSGDDVFEMPIRAVLQNADVELIWAP